jgi:hypothetical protein
LTRWWQFGLVGGVGLSLATLIKVIRVLGGTAGEATWGETVGFAAAIFGMGFVSGVIVWAGRGLYHRIGMAGDAIVGLVVMVVFFTSCMLISEPELLGPKFPTGGAPMLALGAVIGLIAGAWVGRDWRKEFADPEETPRRAVKRVRPAEPAARVEPAKPLVDGVSCALCGVVLRNSEKGTTLCDSCRRQTS